MVGNREKIRKLPFSHSVLPLIFSVISFEIRSIAVFEYAYDWSSGLLGEKEIVFLYFLWSFDYEEIVQNVTKSDQMVIKTLFSTQMIGRWEGMV